MKIAFVAPETRPVPPIKGGAVQLYIDEVIRRLAKGHQITLFSPGGRGVTNPYGKRVRVVRIDRKNYLAKVRKKIKKSYFPIIHTFNRPDFVRSLHSVSPKSKHVLNLHNILGERKRHGWRDGIKKTDYFIANSHFTRRDTLRRFRYIKTGKIKTIHLGIDPDKFIMKWRHHKQVNRLKKKWNVEDKKVVLFVGKLNKKKGIESLIQAGRILKKKHKNLLLIIVGGTDHGIKGKNSYFRKVEKKAKKLLGKKHVWFTGFVSPSKVAEFYAFADVFVCPSLWKEPFGRVNLEAMASGVPVVATKRGGVSEVVIHRKTGYLISNPRNVKRLSRYIHLLLRDPKNSKKMGIAGHKRVVKVFSWKSVVQEIKKVYRSVDRR